MKLTDLPRALTNFSQIEDRLKGFRPVVFLDFDGTLAPIAQRPELAHMPDSMREQVRALSHLCPVGIVSGRDRSVVEAMVGLSNISYAGSHGFDISLPGAEVIRHQVGAEYALLMAPLERQLDDALKDVDGVLIETKAVSLAVHYRQVRAPLQKEVIARVEKILAQTKGLKALRGKMVIELLPAIDWDKGRAVTWLLEALRPSSGQVLPIFLGDDVTDEAAFKALLSADPSGISFFVASSRADITGRETAAGYLLDGPDEVEEFLARLTQTLKG